MTFDPIALIAGVSGLGGMLIGGFIVYHQVNAKLVSLETRINDVARQLECAHEKYVTVRVCETAKTACTSRMDSHDERMDRLDAKFEKVFDKLDRIIEALSRKVDR